MGQIRSASPWKIATPYLKRSTSSLGILPMLVIHQCTSPVLENCKSGYHSVSHTPSSTLTDTSIAPTFTPLTEGETKVSGGCPPPASSPRKQVTSWRQSSQWSKPETLCLWWPNQSVLTGPLLKGFSVFRKCWHSATVNPTPNWRHRSSPLVPPHPCAGVLSHISPTPPTVLTMRQWIRAGPFLMETIIIKIKIYMHQVLC